MSAQTLKVCKLSKRYGDGPAAVEAVQDVSFTVEPGQVVVIMGPSGSGKTTLLLLLGALLRPTAGSVQLGDSVVSTLPEKSLPAFRLHRFGFVFQDYNLLPALTALQNVALVCRLAGVGRAAASSRAEALLNEVGLSGRLHCFPQQLSGGEKQRVAVARALANDADLILADEPTANLDARTGAEVVALLGRLAARSAAEPHSVVIVTHDTRLQGIADRVLWMEDGHLREIPRPGRRVRCPWPALARRRSPRVRRVA